MGQLHPGKLTNVPQKRDNLSIGNETSEPTNHWNFHGTFVRPRSDVPHHQDLRYAEAFWVRDSCELVDPLRTLGEKRKKKTRSPHHREDTILKQPSCLVIQTCTKTKIQGVHLYSWNIHSKWDKTKVYWNFHLRCSIAFFQHPIGILLRTLFPQTLQIRTRSVKQNSNTPENLNQVTNKYLPNLNKSDTVRNVGSLDTSLYLRFSQVKLQWKNLNFQLRSGQLDKGTEKPADATPSEPETKTSHVMMPLLFQ